MNRLTHVDQRDRPAMVDISDKAVSHRVARARGFIRLAPATLDMIAANQIRKGQVLVTAELAGIQAAKQTATLIPLCHNIPLSKVGLAVTAVRDGVEAVSEARCIGRTGVEMEALTAVCVALLTVYDMCKAVDKTMRIEAVSLIEKTKTPVKGEEP